MSDKLYKFPEKSIIDYIIDYFNSDQKYIRISLSQSFTRDFINRQSVLYLKVSIRLINNNNITCDNIPIVINISDIEKEILFNHTVTQLAITNFIKNKIFNEINNYVQNILIHLQAFFIYKTYG